MRPFGAAKGKAIFKAPAPPRFAGTPIRQAPNTGGVKLLPRGNVGVRQPTQAFPQGNPYIDRIATGFPADKRTFIVPRESPLTSEARRAKKTPDGRLLQFFR